MSDLGSDRAKTAADLEGAARGGKAELRLWLRLLSTANIISGQIRRRLREKFGITLPSFDLMAQLDREPLGLRLGELSQRMMVTNGNLTGLVERLVREGLVLRETDPGDRRAFIVRLSDAGKAKFEIYAKENERLVLALFGAVPPEMVQTLMDNLAVLKASARASER
ncbi:MAG TPA: MarR family transcriptional regulator [Rhodoblastus sp.]|nr:MarR family transcriptional regulator [Rhodoblastus sp.]